MFEIAKRRFNLDCKQETEKYKKELEEINNAEKINLFGDDR